MDVGCIYSKTWSREGKMFYRVKFRAAPEEYIFELGDISFKVTVRDAMQEIRNTFKIRNDKLMMYDESSAQMLESDEIQKLRTYILKRMPKV